MVNINAWVQEPTTISSQNLNRYKVLWLGGLGTFLELYDYTLFVTLLPFFADAIFGKAFSNPLAMGYILFAISMLVAPLGAIFWGWVGDRFGRIKVLRFAMYSMAFPSLFISLIPTYEDIGILAPILLLFYRVLQAFSASGELQGSKVFVMEHMGKSSYGVSSGVLSATGSLGVMLSMGMAYYCSMNPDQPEAWRIPFALGAFLAVVGSLVRRLLVEPSKFKANQSLKISEITGVIKSNLRGSAIALSLAGLVGIYSYFNHAFINPFLNGFGVDKQDTYVFAVIGLLASAVGAVLAGLIVDSSLKILLTLRSCVVLISIFFPLFYLMLFSGDPIGIAFGYCGIGMFLGAYAAIAGVSINTIFPTEMRCRGALFTYSTGVAIFGGVTPYMLKTLGALHYMLPAAVIIFAALIVWYILRFQFKNIIVH